MINVRTNNVYPPLPQPEIGRANYEKWDVDEYTCLTFAVVRIEPMRFWCCSRRSSATGYAHWQGGGPHNYPLKLVLVVNDPQYRDMLIKWAKEVEKSGNWGTTYVDQ